MSDAALGPIPFRVRLAELLGQLQPRRTQAWLADESGLSRSVVSRLLSGDRNPTLEHADCLAPVLGVDLAGLLRGTDAEARLQEARQWVRRKDLEQAIASLATYEGKLNDLEARVRDAVTARDVARTRETEARQANESLKRELRVERRRLRRAQREADRNRKLYAEAAAEISRLAGQIEELSGEVQVSGRSSRVGAALAAVAAAASMYTAARLAANDDYYDGGALRHKSDARLRWRRASAHGQIVRG